MSLLSRNTVHVCHIPCVYIILMFCFVLFFAYVLVYLTDIFVPINKQKPWVTKKKGRGGVQ